MQSCLALAAIVSLFVSRGGAIPIIQRRLGRWYRAKARKIRAPIDQATGQQVVQRFLTLAAIVSLFVSRGGAMPIFQRRLSR